MDKMISGIDQILQARIRNLEASQEVMRQQRDRAETERGNLLVAQAASKALIEGLETRIRALESDVAFWKAEDEHSTTMAKTLAGLLSRAL